MTIMNPLKKRRSIFVALSIFGVLIFVLSYLFYFFEYGSYMNWLESKKAEVRASYETVMQQEIKSLKDYWKMDQKAYESAQVSDIKKRTEKAYLTVQRINSQYAMTKTVAERIELASIALAEQRYFENDSGYFFITGTNGQFYLNDSRMTLEGKNGLDEQVVGPVIKKAVEDVIAVALEKKADYYSYMFSKPNEVGTNHQKLAYLMYFDPFKTVIGSGLYYEDIYSQFDKQFENKIAEMNKLNTDSSVLILDYNRKILFDNDKNRIGKKLDNLITIKREDLNNIIGQIYNLSVPIVAPFKWNDEVIDNTQLNHLLVVDNLEDNKSLIMLTKTYSEPKLFYSFFRTSYFTHWLIETFTMVIFIFGIMIAIFIQFRYMQGRMERQFMDEEFLIRGMIDQVDEGIILIDQQGKIRGINKSGMIMMGKNQELLLGKEFDYENKWGLTFSGLVEKNETSLQISIGDTVQYLTFRLKSIVTNGVSTFESLLLIRDVSEIENLKNNLTQIKYFDTLLESYNRQSILALGQKMMNLYPGKNNFVLFDIDGFDYLNHKHGQSVMDRYLKRFAKSIKEGLNPLDAIGRIQGDQLLLVCSQQSDMECGAKVEKIKAILTNEMNQWQIGPINYSVVLLGCDKLATNIMEDVVNKLEAGRVEAKKLGANQVFIIKC